MKKHLTLKLITLAVLLAIAAVGASAQTSTSPGDATTPAVVPAIPTDPFAAGAPAFPKPANVLPAQGSGTAGAVDKNSYVWARWYFFKVHRSNGNPAVINADTLGNVSSVTDFDYGTEQAYKIEAGWNHPINHFGFRVGYFRTSQDADTVTVTGSATAPFFVSPRPLNVTFTGPADIGTTANFRERFRLHVVDIEGSYKWASANHSVVVSGGLRIAPSRQRYEATDIFAGAPELVEYTQRRTGVGPTGAVDLRHRIGGNVWVTGHARVSVLFGSIREVARYTITGFSEVANRKSTRTAPVFEGEGGLEFSPGMFFVNGSFIFHHWHNLVNIMPTAAVGGSAVAALDNPAAAPTRRGSVRFIGVAISGGLRW